MTTGSSPRMWGTLFPYPSKLIYLFIFKNSTNQIIQKKLFKGKILRINILRQKRNKFNPIHFFWNPPIGT
jgi:hypothetical protein